MDVAILNYIAEHLRTPLLDQVFSAITALNDYGLIWIGFAIVMLCTKRYRRGGIAITIALALSFLIGNLLLKHLIDRVRPFVTYPMTLLIAVPAGSSFPSAHTLSSFAAAMAIWRTERRLGIPAMILAALIAFSRLYLYVHYPSDVLAGAILGLWIGWLAVWLVNRKKRVKP